MSSATGNQILKQLGYLCIYTLLHEQIDKDKYKNFSTLSEQCKKNTYHLRVLTKDLVFSIQLEQTSSHQRCFTCSTNCPAKNLPSLQGLFSLLNQATERQMCHLQPNGLIFKLTGYAYFFKDTLKSKDAEICLGA